MRFHRFRVLVAPDRAVELNPYHGPMVYATLAAAYGLATKGGPLIPDGMLIEAPEQGRVRVERDQPLAIGWTMVSDGSVDARLRCGRVIEGLRQLGIKPRQAGKPLGGGFTVIEVRDIIADAVLRHDSVYQGVDVEGKLTVAAGSLLETVPAASAVGSQADGGDRGRGAVALSLRLTTPLRMARPGNAKRPGHQFMDHDWFSPRAWLGGLQKRLNEVGLDQLCPQPEVCSVDDALIGSDRVTGGGNEFLCDGSRLVWLDLPYRGTGGDKTLGGVVGQIDLPPLDLAWLSAVFWGQLIGVGRTTRMGLGRYVIEAPRVQLSQHGRQLSLEEQSRVVASLRRSQSLLDLALPSDAIDRGAARYRLPPGVAATTVHSIRSGTYTPDPHHRYVMHDGDKRPRPMSVPSRRDRAMQVALLESIAPAIDCYLENSSFAYRKGFSRHSAAKVIKRLSGQGFRWAIRSDIHRFFDSVDHRVLHARLMSYLPDEPLVGLLMQWVDAASGSDSTRRGLPTGAPISPVLANLFLDRFDEMVTSDDARLVRYADDFLILYRECSAAERVMQTATAAAESLRLKLNEAKTQSVAPQDSFEFLGFRFQRERDWRFAATLPPADVDTLGWIDLKASAVSKPTQIELPVFSGEDTSRGRTKARPSMAVLTGYVKQLTGAPGKLIVRDGAGVVLKKLSCRSLRFVLVRGMPTVEQSAWRQLVEHRVELLMVGPSGHPVCRILTRRPQASQSLRTAQLSLVLDIDQGLPVAIKLVAAKLRNTATACLSLIDGAERFAVAEQLRSLADQTREARTHSQLMGMEGAGAAAWYGLYGRRLPADFQFQNRCSPRATDPANAMLNVAHSHLHRLCEAAAIASNLLPELGVLHRQRAGHLALASDLQEPFRHLADRAVWVACQRLRKSDFERRANERFPIRIMPRAMSTLFKVLYQSIEQNVQDRKDRETNYREHLFRQTRDLGRWMSDRQVDFEPFEHQDA